MISDLIDDFDEILSPFSFAVGSCSSASVLTEICSLTGIVVVEANSWFLGKLTLRYHFHLQILAEGLTVSLNWVFFQKLEKDFSVVTVDNLSSKEALEKSFVQMDLDTVSLNIIKLTFNSKIAF